MTYTQLADWIGELLDTIDELHDELKDDYCIALNYCNCHAVYSPDQVKENILNDLQGMTKRFLESV